MLSPNYQHRRGTVLCLHNSPYIPPGIQIAPDIRIFLFAMPPVHFEVDFIKQNHSEQNLFIVPTNHSYRISVDTNTTFTYFDIPADILSNSERSLIFYLKYQPQKSLRLNGSTKDIHSKLITGAQECYYYKYEYVVSCIEAQIPTHLTSKPIYQRYLEIAYKLQLFLDKTDLRLNNSNIDFIADETGISPKNLHRACIAAFGVPAKVVLKQQLLLKSIALFSKPKYSMTAIADQLGFSSISAFDRYVKRLTGFTPTRLRSVIGYEDIVIQNEHRGA
jgi:AraC-like DNA-binding protein